MSKRPRRFPRNKKYDKYTCVELGMLTRYAGWIYLLMYRRGQFAKEDVAQLHADWNHLDEEERECFEAIGLGFALVHSIVHRDTTLDGYSGCLQFYRDDLPPEGTTRRALYKGYMDAKQGTY